MKLLISYAGLLSTALFGSLYIATKKDVLSKQKETIAAMKDYQKLQVDYHELQLSHIELQKKQLAFSRKYNVLGLALCSGRLAQTQLAFMLNNGITPARKSDFYKLQEEEKKLADSAVSIKLQ